MIPTLTQLTPLKQTMPLSGTLAYNSYVAQLRRHSSKQMVPLFPIGFNAIFCVLILTFISFGGVLFWCYLVEPLLLQVLTKPYIAFMASVFQKCNVCIAHVSKYMHMLTTGGIMSIIYKKELLVTMLISTNKKGAS